MVKAGWNISLGDLGHRYDEAMANAAASGADFHLVMTNPQHGVNGAGEINEIQRWKDAMPAGTRLLWRTYLATDGEWIRTLGFNTGSDMMRLNETAFREHCRIWAENLADRWFREGHLDVIRDDPDNEPKLAGASYDVHRRYAISREQLIVACRKRGVKVAVGAFAVGLPHESMVENGALDPMLKVAEYLSVHEYPTAMPGVGDVIGYDAMLDPQSLWEKLPKAVWAIKKAYFLMRRCDRLKLQADALGNTGTKYIISETSTNEDIPDAHHYTSQLRDTYAKAECGGDLRGVQAWSGYHADVFGSSDGVDHVRRIFEYILTFIYNVPHVVGVCFYALNYSWGNGQRGRYRCHNFLGEAYDSLRRDKLPELNAQQKDKTMPETVLLRPLPDNFTWMMKRAKVASAGVNIRETWTTLDDNVLFLFKDSTEAFISANAFYNPDDGYHWRRIEFDDGKEGYVARGYIRDTEIAPPTPPAEEPVDDNTKPIPPIDDDTLIVLTDEQLDDAVVRYFDKMTVHVPKQTQADIPIVLARILARILRFMAFVIDPDIEQEKSPLS